MAVCYIMFTTHEYYVLVNYKAMVRERIDKEFILM